MPTEEGETVILMGCHAQSLHGASFVFTRHGQIPSRVQTYDGVAQGIAILRGDFPRVERGACYEMAVKVLGTGLLEYFAGYGGTPFKVAEYRLLHRLDAARKTSGGASP